MSKSLGNFLLVAHDLLEKYDGRSAATNVARPRITASRWIGRKTS
jgi:cysteinyl-tRNA synthetase